MFFGARYRLHTDRNCRRVLPRYPYQRFPERPFSHRSPFWGDRLQERTAVNRPPDRHYGIFSYRSRFGITENKKTSPEISVTYGYLFEALYQKYGLHPL